ncbi:hypothetical protein ACFL04_00880 [Patescibacteria group bacterium]
MKENKYNIYFHNRHLGSITIDQKGKVAVKGEDNFKSTVKEAMSAGITVLVDKPIKKGRVMVEQKTDSQDPNFGLALIQWLKRKGYMAIRERPELDDQIRKLIKKIPDDNPAKQKIIAELPGMTTLEKTYLISKLSEKK